MKKKKMLDIEMLQETVAKLSPGAFFNLHF